MDILEWFDISNIEHLRAYMLLNEVGVWPMGFIPADVTFSSLWNGRLNSRMAGLYVALRTIDIVLTDELHEKLNELILTYEERLSLLSFEALRKDVLEKESLELRLERNLEIVKLVRGV